MFAVLGKDEGDQMFERFDKRNEETNERQSQLDIKRSSLLNVIRITHWLTKKLDYSVRLLKSYEFATLFVTCRNLWCRKIRWFPKSALSKLLTESNCCWKTWNLSRLFKLRNFDPFSRSLSRFDYGRILGRCTGVVRSLQILETLSLYPRGLRRSNATETRLEGPWRWL